MADQTPVEEIRQAAVAIALGAEYARKAMQAVPGPPYPTADAFREALSRQFPTSWGMAQHVARWTPEAAQAVAALLEHLADGYGTIRDQIECPSCGESASCPHPTEGDFCDRCLELAPCGCIAPALAAARAINGGAA